MSNIENVKIKIDPYNPGHFFACCGLFDLVSHELPEALARFVTDSRRPRFGEFEILGATELGIQRALQIIKGASYSALPVEDRLRAVAPILAQTARGPIQLDWWLRIFQDGSTALKGWGGQVTSLKLFQDLSALIPDNALLDQFLDYAKPTSSRFGVDPRSAWNSIDLGYSPNEQGQEADSFPLVEILSAFALQTFRPNIGRRRSVNYFLWAEPIPCSIARLAAYEPWPGLSGFPMQFSIESRGQSYKYFAFAQPCQQTEDTSEVQNITEDNSEEDN